MDLLYCGVWFSNLRRLVLACLAVRGRREKIVPRRRGTLQFLEPRTRGGKLLSQVPAEVTVRLFAVVNEKLNCLACDLFCSPNYARVVVYVTLFLTGWSVSQSNYLPVRICKRNATSHERKPALIGPRRRGGTSARRYKYLI